MAGLTLLLVGLVLFGFLRIERLTGVPHFPPHVLLSAEALRAVNEWWFLRASEKEQRRYFFWIAWSTTMAILSGFSLVELLRQAL